MLLYQADRAGSLPGAPNAIVGVVRLPAGRLIVPDPDFAGAEPVTSPVLWVTNDAVDDVSSLWISLAKQFPTTGLWPLVLESLGEDDDERPWLCGEFDPGSSTTPENQPVRDILAEWWGNGFPEEEDAEELQPFGREFPGLAPASPPTPIEREAPDNVVVNLNGRLGLVSVRRPADVLSVLGWMGPANHFEDMGLLSAVLRSWEDRFGAYLVGAGFATLTLGVQRPPQNIALATQIAAEHFAACSDNIYQGAGSIAAYSKDLVDSPAWTFWWD